MSVIRNRLGLVPAIGVYEHDGRSAKHLDDFNVDLAWDWPKPVGEKFIAEWVLYDLRLGLTCGSEDQAPDADRSAAPIEVAAGKAYVALTPEQFIGAVRGPTRWGESGSGVVVVFAWSLDDIDEITITRPRRFGRLWDHGEVFVRSTEPRAWLGATTVLPKSTSTKRLKQKYGGIMMGFGWALGSAAAAAQDAKTQINTEEGTEGFFWQKYREDIITLTS